jgi:hypothetical protein
MVMTRTRLFSSFVIAGVLAASVSGTAFAGDYHHDRGGNGAALAVGILGAVVIGSLIANSQPAYAAPQPQPYYQPQPYPVYEAQPQAYYPPAPVQQTYYAPPQQYYAPQPVVVVGSRYRERHERREYRERGRDGYYYSR